jgi:7,8-dihydropterin-6-yl-methyl-4-(beta-D-ribofuranosyl)aminobenzene 5'-phosphate synthase
MLKELNRREFLKASVATASVVLASNPSGGASVAHASVKVPAADEITITVITDNYCDALRGDYKIANRHVAAPGSPLLNMSLHAEHGLAYHIETLVNGESHSFLFDYGTDFRGVGRNMELLAIDFKKVEALGLSHDHFDHQAALVQLLKSKSEGLRKGIPFYVGEKTFLGTFMSRAGNIVSLEALKREEIESLGFVKIVEVKDPTPIVPGAYLTGKIEQVTDYEQISAMFVAINGDEFVQETFSGEQAVILNAKGKGLVVLSGCAHRGIVNTVKHAQKVTGIEKVHAVIGGFHLIGASPELIRKTIADMKSVSPDYIVPTHCTGFEAIVAFAKEMPDQFIISTAGTKYILTA